MKKSILVVAMLLMVSAFLSADIYIKMETKSAMMPTPVVTEQYYGGDKLVMNIPNMSTTIMDMAAKKTTVIMHMMKTYTEAPMKGEAAGAKPTATFSVTPNGQTKKVGKWNCKGYTVKSVVNGMTVNMVFWATSDIPDWKTLSKKFTDSQKVQAGYGAAYDNEMKKVDGYPVLMEIDASGMKMTMTVTEINPNKAIPADLLKIPAGYKKQ